MFLRQSRRIYALTYAYAYGMITTMNDLHPAATELTKIEAEYTKILAKLAAIKATRRACKRAHKAAIIEAITETPDATHVDLAARFAVTEGTIRQIRRNMAEPIVLPEGDGSAR